MALSDDKIREYNKRILLSRMRILCNHGFYGLLLMHMIFAIDEGCETAATDGYRIYFGPEFMDNLSDSELDFVMMHEILHVALQHCMRRGDRDAMVFNIACDIVVNSNILLSNEMDNRSITLKKYGESMHLAPDGKEGYKYSAEEIYEILLQNSMLMPDTGGSSDKESGKSKSGSGDGSAQGKGNKSDGDASGEGQNGEGDASGGKGGTASGRADNGGDSSDGGGMDKPGSGWDDHSRWEVTEESNELREVWIRRVIDAAKAIEIRDPSNTRGTVPLCLERILAELKKPQTDWRTILQDFIQEEVCDYSFAPPDRRFDESPFFLPDFNEKEDMVKDILFMIDTSGSMSDTMITAAYSEVKGAIDQFDGKLGGWLGFFDAAIVEPQPFENEDEFKIIKPAGGGGTDFQIIFEYVAKYMQDNPPASIIILTDGYAPFLDEAIARDIPVLWLLNNDEVDPPWGRIARIKI